MPKDNFNGHSVEGQSKAANTLKKKENHHEKYSEE
jgi:hypothetical protein